MMLLWVPPIEFFKSERKTEGELGGEPLFMWNKQFFEVLHNGA